jgi:hypothetical protein
MISISRVVEDLVLKDPIALRALQRGIVNFSSYARQIKTEVEHITKKAVDEKSIVMALSRFAKEKQLTPPEQNFIIDSLSVQTNLHEYTYERTEKGTQLIRGLHKKIFPKKETFLTVTQGITEVSIIAESKTALEYKKALKDLHLIYENTNLVGVTMKFDLKYLQVPNMMAQLTNKLAIKDINIIEIVSTSTEMTFIIERDSLEDCLQQFGCYL